MRLLSSPRASSPISTLPGSPPSLALPELHPGKSLTLSLLHHRQTLAANKETFVIDRKLAVEHHWPLAASAPLLTTFQTDGQRCSCACHGTLSRRLLAVLLAFHNLQRSARVSRLSLSNGHPRPSSAEPPCTAHIDSNECYRIENRPLITLRCRSSRLYNPFQECQWPRIPVSTIFSRCPVRVAEVINRQKLRS